MNDRIKELKSQALKECLDKSDGLVQGETITLREFHDSVEQRFVELIVRDIAMFSIVITDDHYDVDALYRHYGVEE